jgi:hypothetical protein
MLLSKIGLAFDNINFIFASNIRSDKTEANEIAIIVVS